MKNQSLWRYSSTTINDSLNYLTENFYYDLKQDSFEIGFQQRMLCNTNQHYLAKIG